MDSAQLLELKNSLDNGEVKNILAYINLNQITEMPQQIRKQLVDEFGRETMQPIFMKMRGNKINQSDRIDFMANKFVSEEDVDIDACDEMLNALNRAIEVVNSKKNDLSG